jgi:hypothetical protein
VTPDLAHKAQRLCRNRSAQWGPSLGTHYVVDVVRNFVLQADVELEDLARELGVLQPARAAV